MVCLYIVLSSASLVTLTFSSIHVFVKFMHILRFYSEMYETSIETTARFLAVYK